MKLPRILGDLSDETRRGVGAIALFALAVIFGLSAANLAGVAGEALFSAITYLLGIGYYLLPILCIVLGIALFRSIGEAPGISRTIGAILFLVAGLGLVEIAAQNEGGILGRLIAEPLTALFEIYASVAILSAALIVAILMIFDARLTLPRLPAFLTSPLTQRKETLTDEELVIRGVENVEEDESEAVETEEEAAESLDEVPEFESEEVGEAEVGTPSPLSMRLGEYTPPPLSLLERDKGKPGVGDIKANANIIKRTLANFGITVEMDEVSIGPTVTRYALKPAEGVRLSKIVSLQNNLELALAAHPVRIEAPIPGKSLVGIEVPNTTKSTVGLATLLSSPEWSGSDKPLMVTLGRDIAGSVIMGNVAKMPHVLIAGATGSGKSVTIHALITSLIYRNSPDILRFIMIDPKRVELTLYNSIPHLLTPVITEAKKTILALKWAAKEMDRRYDILEAEKVRDIDSYHKNILAPALEKASRKDSEDPIELMPYIVVIIDELADIMGTYPRELEAAVVRLAQMSRAVGIHLVLSTQRPSVNVITGLIKANVPARVALQVASQIDSRTILDQGGAEKLLGAGDMLYLSGDMGKPVRIQAPYITESEVKKVVKYLKDHYDEALPGIDFSETSQGRSDTLGGAFDSEEEVDEEAYEQARMVVEEAGKASTSYLQRKMRIGYGRAARIMDMLEERGVIGPANGSRPREVLTRKEGFGVAEEDEV